MTRPWWECTYQRFSKGEEAKPLAEAANQRFLNAKASIADITTEVENDRWESVRKLAQAPDVSTSAALKKVGQLSDQNGLLRFATIWRRSDSGQQNVCNDERHRFLTISDNVLNVVEKAGCEERAGQPHPYPGVLLQGVEGGTKNAAVADLAMRSGSEKSVREYVKIAGGHIDKS